MNQRQQVDPFTLARQELFAPSPIRTRKPAGRWRACANPRCEAVWDCKYAHGAKKCPQCGGLLEKATPYDRRKRGRRP